MTDHRLVSAREVRRNGQRGNTLLPAQGEAIHEILSTLVRKIPAHFTLLVNAMGQVVISLGETADCNLATLGALIASDHAASQEIARITGELHNYQIVLREGNKTHNFIIDAGRNLIVFVQVPNEIPLGWARMLMRRAAIKLEKATSGNGSEEIDQELDLSSREALDLFGQAIDDLWSG